MIITLLVNTCFFYRSQKLFQIIHIITIKFPGSQISLHSILQIVSFFLINGRVFLPLYIEWIFYYWIQILRNSEMVSSLLIKTVCLTFQFSITLIGLRLDKISGTSRPTFTPTIRTSITCSTSIEGSLPRFTSPFVSALDQSVHHFRLIKILVIWSCYWFYMISLDYHVTFWYQSSIGIDKTAVFDNKRFLSLWHCSKVL